MDFGLRVLATFLLLAITVGVLSVCVVLYFALIQWPLVVVAFAMAVVVAWIIAPRIIRFD